MTTGGPPAERLRVALGLHLVGRQSVRAGETSNGAPGSMGSDITWFSVWLDAGGNSVLGVARYGGGTGSGDTSSNHRRSQRKEFEGAI